MTANVPYSRFPDEPRASRMFDGLLMWLLLLPSGVGICVLGGARWWMELPLLLLIFLATAVLFLRTALRRGLPVLCLPPGFWLWTAFCLYAFLRWPFSEIPYEARLDAVKVLGCLLAYWAWAQLGGPGRRWKIAVVVLLLLVSLVGWYALIQQQKGLATVLWLERPASYGMRASGSYLCPNHFAHLVAMVLPLAMALLLSSAGVVLRLFCAYAIAVLSPALYLTQSRSGWLGATVGLGIVLLLSAWRRSKRLCLVLLVVLPVLAGTGVVLLWRYSPMVRERLSGMSLDSPDPAVQARLYIWQDTPKLFKDRPVYGFGGGSFAWVYHRYRTNELQYLFNFAHNEYIQLLLEYGAVGLALMACFVVWVLLRLFWLVHKAPRGRDAALAIGALGALLASLAHAVFDFNLHIFSNAQVLVLIVGLAMAAAFSSGTLRGFKLTTGWRRAGVAVGCLPALLAAASLVPTGVSAIYVWQAEKARDQVDLKNATRLYEKAARWDPENYKAHAGAAHVLRMRAFWLLDPAEKQALAHQALTTFQAAFRWNPCDGQVALGASKTCLLLGQPEESLEWMRRAVATDPYRAFYLNHLGLQLRRMGRLDEARAAFERALPLGSGSEMAVINVREIKALQAASPGVAPAVE